MPQLILKSKFIKDVASRWKSSYFGQNKWLDTYIVNGRTKEQIYKELIKLGDNATEEKIISIIGNRSWTNNTCHECERDVDVLVQLGQKPDYESYTARICTDCITNALNLVKESNATKED